MNAITGRFRATPKTIFNIFGIIVCMLMFPDKIAAQPTFVTFPANVTVECDNVPVAKDPLVGGSCLPVSVCLSLESYFPGSCPNSKILQREWTAKDNCGKMTTRIQQILIKDTKAPQISFIRQELIGKKNNDTITLDCRYAYGLGTEDVHATDNCDTKPIVVFKDNAVKVGNCQKDGFVLFMYCSWIATDACGNKSVLSIYIKFVDTTPPDIWNEPADITVACEGKIDTSKVPDYKDFCDGQPVLKESRNIIPGNCAGNYQIVRTWTATDACGNSRSVSQTVFVIDNIVPTIKSKPQDLTIAYNQPYPPAADIEASDNCGQQVFIKLTESKSVSGCDTVLTRTWGVRDWCGNLAAATQKITKISQGPKLATLVADSAKVCLRNATALLSARANSTEIIPAGYSRSYLLCDQNQILIQTGNSSAFVVNATGKYTIHTIIYDSRFDPASIEKGKTLFAAVVQQLAGICATWDAAGVEFKVEICNIIPNDTTKCIRPQIANIAIRNPDCGLNNGNICLQVSPSSSIIQWINPASTSNCIENLAAGTYKVRISNKTDANCYREENIIVNSHTDFVINNPLVKSSSCSGNDGEIEFPATGFVYLWSDNSTANKRSDLASGEYFITVSPSNSTCKKVIKVAVPQSGTLSANIEIVKRPDCRDNNGSVKINVNGGSGNYEFSIPATNNVIQNLIAGFYNIIVTDKVSKCTTTVQFALANDSLVAGLINSSVENGKCAGDFAKLNISLNLPSGFANPATVLVVDGDNKIHDPAKLHAGKYTILLFDRNQCMKSYQEITIDAKVPLELNYSSSESLCKGNIFVKVKGGAAPYRYDWSDLAGNTDPADRNNIKPGKYNLVVKDANNCEVQINPEISNQSCGDTCINWFTQSSYQLRSNDCAAGIGWCAPIPFSIFKSTMTLYQNGALYNAAVDSCGQFTKIALAVGQHQLVFSQIRGKNVCTDTVTVNVACDNCPQVYSGAAIVRADSCKGSAKICLNVSKSYLSQVKIRVNGSPYNGNIGDCGNGNAALTFSPGRYQISFNDTLWACASNFSLTIDCDTLKDTPVNSLVIEKDLYIGDTFSYCLDTSELNKGPYTVSNICAVNYKAISYTLNGLCLNIKADTLGSESLCMVVCDPYKRCDTTYFVINVIPKKPIPSRIDTLYRDVFVGKNDTVCLNTRGLGVLDTLYNFCPGESGQFVRFENTNVLTHVKYIGLAVGKEKGCFVICDTQGKCDTTIVYINCKKDSSGVDTTKRPPIAVIDFATTKFEKPVDIDVLANDTINGTLKMLDIFENPKKGDIYVIQDNNGHMTLVYVPNDGICGFVDTFSYYIENEHGRDTAQVVITVNCQQMIIFNGFSPNGDNINDTFTILGIEEFPDNDLFIANRWGNQVYFTKGYSNREAWDGTWNGSQLPDGTYYYCLRLLKINKTYTGYIEIRR
ncbi:MAG: gliding motility-associated C-terminal domain-containing protein [Saprospiraceae bacterium]